MNKETLSQVFAVVLMLLCLATAATYVVGIGNANLHTLPTQTQTQTQTQTPTQTPTQPQAHNAPAQAATAATTPAAAGQPAPGVSIALDILLLTSLACAGGWFAHAFTGDTDLSRRKEQVRFAYFFAIASFAFLMIPPFVKNQAIGSELIGIVSGCVDDPEAAAQLRCHPQADDKAAGADRAASAAALAPTSAPTTGTATQTASLHNQWLVNLGGAMRPQQGTPCALRASANCTLGSSDNRVEITGGVVVPLPFVIIALFGGAISLSRRVPEIQKRSEPDYKGTDTEPKIDARQAREELVFQMMQFVSAPLIAITAHQVIEPSSQASAVALAFLAGFGSETILLMIRGVAEGIRPKIASQRTSADTADEAAGKGTSQGAGAAADGALGAGGQSAQLLGREPQGASAATPASIPPGAAPVHVRLCIVDDGLDAGSLALSVDGGAPANMPDDGCVELALAPGREHRVEAHGRRAGREVRGELAVTPDADDEGKPFELALV